MYLLYTDPMYQGVYHGKDYHSPDLDSVLKRSYEAGVEKVEKKIYRPTHNFFCPQILPRL